MALKTNTWGLVLAGSREAERITSQIEQGQWTKKQQRKGSVTFNIFSIFSVWLLSSDQYIDIPIKLFPKKWRTGVVQLSHATAIATQQCGVKRGKHHHTYTIWPCLLFFCCVLTKLLYRVWVEPSDTLNILIMEEPFRAIFRLHTHNRILHSFSM